MVSTRRHILKACLAGVGPFFLPRSLRAQSPDGRAGPTGNAGVSVLGFINPIHHQGILDGTGTHDAAVEIQSAIDSGENLYFPGGQASNYNIDGQLRLSQSFQRLFSGGWARLNFRGTNPAANAIELLSTRRDTGSTSATREAQSIEGFRLVGPGSARYASLIFIEEGTFSPFIEKVFSEAGTNKGYFGRLADSYIRVNGNSRSYVNDVTIRDCLFSGLRNEQSGRFPPCGIWIEGAIEGRVENTKVFYFDECMRLGDAAGQTRNVQHMVFDQVQLEPTKPTQVVDGQASLNIYTASDCTFRDSRFDPGNGQGSENSVAVRVSPGGRGAHQVRFRDCSFQGMRHARHMCHVLAGATVVDMDFSGGDVRSFTSDLVLDETKGAGITMDHDTFVDGR